MKMINDAGEVFQQTTVLLPRRQKDIVKQHGITITSICRDALRRVAENLEKTGN
jgi:hypothetical protein